MSAVDTVPPNPLPCSPPAPTTEPACRPHTATEGAMDLHTSIGELLTDERLLFNLIAIHALIGVTLIVSMIVKQILVRGSDRLAHLTGLHWLDGVSQEAVRRARSVLFWLTLGAM